MRNIKLALAVVVLTTFTFGGLALGGDTKVYKASGEITRATGAMMTLRTAAADMDINYDAKTKVTGGKIATHSNATVTYTKANGAEYATEVAITKKTR
jgi:hypothetical protein